MKLTNFKVINSTAIALMAFTLVSTVSSIEQAHGPQEVTFSSALVAQQLSHLHIRNKQLIARQSTLVSPSMTDLLLADDVNRLELVECILNHDLRWTTLKNHFDEISKAIRLIQDRRGPNVMLLEDYFDPRDLPDPDYNESNLTKIRYDDDKRRQLKTEHDQACKRACDRYKVSQEDYPFLRMGALEISRSLEEENRQYNLLIGQLLTWARKTLSCMRTIYENCPVEDLNYMFPLASGSNELSDTHKNIRLFLDKISTFPEQEVRLMAEIDHLGNVRSEELLAFELENLRRVMGKELSLIFNDFIESNVKNITWENFVRWILVINTDRMSSLLTNEKIWENLFNLISQELQPPPRIEPQKVMQHGQTIKLTDTGKHQAPQVARGRVAQALIRVVKAAPDKKLKDLIPGVKGDRLANVILSVLNPFFTWGKQVAKDEARYQILRVCKDPSTLPIDQPGVKGLLHIRYLCNPQRLAGSWIADGIQNETVVGQIDNQLASLKRLREDKRQLNRRMVELGRMVVETQDQTSAFSNDQALFLPCEQEAEQIKQDFMAFLIKAKEFQEQLTLPYKNDN